MKMAESDLIVHTRIQPHIPCLIDPHKFDRCIYVDILENIDLGILLLDIENETVLFQNEAVTNILGLYRAKNAVSVRFKLEKVR